jgi:hypothetical protein
MRRRVLESWNVERKVREKCGFMLIRNMFILCQDLYFAFCIL